MAQPELVFVLPDFNGGGAQRVALMLTNELARRGRRLAVLVLNGTGPLAPTVSPSVPIVDLHAVRLRSAMFALVRHLRDIRPRYVFSTLGYVNLAVLCLRPYLPADTRVWLREANLPSISLSKGRFPTLARLAYRILYPRSDLLICSSERMRREFLADFGVPDAIVRVLPNPVDEMHIRVSSGAAPFGSSSGPRFVAAGRLTKQKGFDRLIDMFAALDDPSSRLRILGDGPMAPELRAQAARLCVADRIEFSGFVANPWHSFGECDAFLLPSRWEGMPNVALEALALGIPVIATPESGGIGEVAEAATPGAVTVAEAGPMFIAAMRNVVPRPVCGDRESLLPSSYRIEKVIDTFERWLDQDG